MNVVIDRAPRLLKGSKATDCRISSPNYWANTSALIHISKPFLSAPQT